MAALLTEPRIARPDDVYDLLIGLHAGMDESRSHVVNAKLIFLLANHIGDEDVIRAAIDVARNSDGRPPTAPPPDQSDG